MANSFNQNHSDTATKNDTSMEEDNNSATTEAMGASTTFKAPHMMDKCVKIIFCVTANEEASTVAQGHFQTLKAITIHPLLKPPSRTMQMRQSQSSSLWVNINASKQFVMLIAVQAPQTGTSWT
jgi:hypothetical protein